MARQTVCVELNRGRRTATGGFLAYVGIRRARRRVMANVQMVRRGYAQVMTTRRT